MAFTDTLANGDGMALTNALPHKGINAYADKKANFSPCTHSHFGERAAGYYRQGG